MASVRIRFSVADARQRVPTMEVFSHRCQGNPHLSLGGMKGSMFFRAANWMMTAAFLFSVAVQYNDPDPVRWMLIYGLAAVACVLMLLRRLRWYLPAAVGAAALGWAASLVPDVIGKTTLGEMFQSFRMINTVVEEAREMGGLLIVAGWMAVLVAVSKKAGRKTE